MSNNLLKLFIVFAISFAPLGQQMVYAAASCEMLEESPMSKGHASIDHEKMNHHEGMELHGMEHHEGMNHDVQTDSSSMSGSCCDTECACPMNSCTSVTYYTAQEQKMPSITGSTELILGHLAEQPISIIKSLFRPPIFA